MNALEHAQALGELLKLRFGELTIRYADGVPTVIRLGRTLRPEELKKLN